MLHFWSVRGLFRKNGNRLLHRCHIKRGKDEHEYKRCLMLTYIKNVTVRLAIETPTFSAFWSFFYSNKKSIFFLLDFILTKRLIIYFLSMFFMQDGRKWKSYEQWFGLQIKLSFSSSFWWVESTQVHFLGLLESERAYNLE